MTEVELYEHRSELMRQIRENPHTDSILSLVNWASLILLVLGLAPCLIRVWKTNRIGSGIIPIWFILILWYIWACFIAPDLAQKWTGERRVWYFFPEGPAVVAIAFGGWAPALLLSSLTWIIKWLYFRVISRKRSPAD